MPSVNPKAAEVLPRPANARTVALLRYPFPVDVFERLQQALEAAYGAGLVLSEEPPGWLNIAQPAWKEEAKP